MGEKLMKDLLAQIRAANNARFYYVALLSALALPDICGALESDDGLSTQSKFVNWFDRFVSPKYTNSGGSTLTGQDAYFFRCSMLHQGRTQHPKSSYSRILFVEPGSTGIILHNNVINDALNIDVRIFIEDIVSSAEKWLQVAMQTSEFQKNYLSFVTRYPQGLKPYITGVPVIS
jgi:hypothetical protein